MLKRLNTQNGFSLLEVLVAFSILAISLTVILAIFSRGMRTAALSEDYRRAMLLADNKMIELLHLQRLREGIVKGKADSFAWQTEVIQAKDSSASGIRHTLNRYDVNIEVSWREGGKQRSLTLHNLALKE